ncbi:hypothetical protein O9H85_08340 [Paenibacillus filicis]|uniref:Flagellar hook-length control protein-like C-terminal domain-containing protein n=1 Tax=Paenibacillus gyeongsangnamensis TaxID=3388067 RepID=A0ABT4Q6E2_9BACL|nr:hypothetical protein [Paenibacillus filicis]MCZ8512441.1 hypothetical protein [Paenibacillus filicis]
MNIGGLIRSLTGDAQAAEPKTLELKSGEVVRGVVLQTYSDQEALVNISGVQVRAKMETPLTPGDSTLLQVQPESSGGQVVLKPVQMANVPLAELPLGDVLKTLGLSDVPVNRQLVQLLHRAGIELSPENVKAFAELLPKMPSSIKMADWMPSAVIAFQKGLPLTPETVQSIRQAVQAQPLHETLEQLEAYVSEQLDGGSGLTPRSRELLQGVLELIRQVRSAAVSQAGAGSAAAASQEGSGSAESGAPAAAGPRAGAGSAAGGAPAAAASQAGAGSAASGAPGAAASQAGAGSAASGAPAAAASQAGAGSAASGAPAAAAPQAGAGSAASGAPAAAAPQAGAGSAASGAPAAAAPQAGAGSAASGAPAAAAPQAGAGSAASEAASAAAAQAGAGSAAGGAPAAAAPQAGAGSAAGGAPSAAAPQAGAGSAAGGAPSAAAPQAGAGSAAGGAPSAAAPQAGAGSAAGGAPSAAASQAGAGSAAGGAPSAAAVQAGAGSAASGAPAAAAPQAGAGSAASGAPAAAASQAGAGSAASGAPAAAAPQAGAGSAASGAPSAAAPQAGAGSAAGGAPSAAAVQAGAGSAAGGAPSAAEQSVQSDAKMGAQPAADHWLGRMMKSLGIEHEHQALKRIDADPASLANQLASDSTDKPADTLKSMLLQLSRADDLPAGIKEAAQQAVQQITGQQLLLMPGRDALFSQITLFVPLLNGNGEQTASIHIQSRKGKNGRLDADNCRLVFDLSMRSLGNTMVDVQVVNKIVSLHVHNDLPFTQELLESQKEEIKDKLSSIGYQFISLKCSPYPSPRFGGTGAGASANLETDSARLSSVYVQKPYKGVDIRL